jgi:tetratricopeptide (TPR) repeat protein
MLFAQRESADVRRGNIAYKDSSYTDAEVHYRRGLDVNDQSFEGHFNLGDALFRQEKYPEALEQYAEAEKLLKANDKLQEEQLNSRLAATYHNIGNALYAQQQYDKAVAAYQQSLRHNPKDNDTRYNLVKAMQQLQQQQQQQNQQQNDQQNQKHHVDQQNQLV